GGSYAAFAHAGRVCSRAIKAPARCAPILSIPEFRAWGTEGRFAQRPSRRGSLETGRMRGRLVGPLAERARTAPSLQSNLLPRAAYEPQSDVLSEGLRMRRVGDHVMPVESCSSAFARLPSGCNVAWSRPIASTVPFL